MATIVADLNGGDAVTADNNLTYKVYNDTDSYAVGEAFGKHGTTGVVVSSGSVTITGVAEPSGVTAYKITSIDEAGNESIKSDAKGSAYLLDVVANGNAAYSLRKLKSTATVAVEVQRDNDDAKTDVLLDDSGSVTLTSIVSAGGTLGTWVGSNNAYIRTWYDQSGNSFDLQETAIALMPEFILAGSLVVKNSLGALKFAGNNDILERTALASLNAGNSFSIFTVSAAAVGDTLGAILNTTDAVSPRLVMYRDARITPNRNTTVLDSDTSAFNADLSAVRNTTDQILSSVHTDGSSYDSFDNGATGGVITPTLNDYTNDLLRIGAQQGYLSRLAGTIQEIIIFSADKSSDRATVEADINNFYTIF